MSLFVFIIEDWWDSANRCHHQARARSKPAKPAANSRPYRIDKYALINNDYRKEFNRRFRRPVPNLCFIKLASQLSKCFHKFTAYGFAKSFKYTLKGMMFCYPQNQVNSLKKETCRDALGRSMTKLQSIKLLGVS